MKVQTKLTLSLLLSGLLAASLVGGIAYWAVMRDFQKGLMDRAFENFHDDVTAYLQPYGSWEEASAQTGFHDFVKQRRPLPPDRPEHTIDRGNHPPFRFLLVDPQGNVLIHSGEYERGDQVPATVLEQARPVQFNGEVAVMAVPIGTPRLTDQDESYLRALRNALFTGFSAAFLVAVSMGLLIGRGMTGTLRELIEAIHGMKADRELEQPVRVRSSDEFGELAQAYNRMNQALSQAHKELREAAEELQELSIRDSLTGLYNRRHFQEQSNRLYEQSLRYEHPLSVMIGDLDFFKKVNDTFSHAAGDEVLRRVGKLLKEHVRKSDIVARYGGEEFVIIFPETSLEEAVRICEAIRRVVERHPWQEIHPDLVITMSMGLSDNIILGDVDKMLGEADERLYEAKHKGRNRVIPPVTAAA